VKAATSAAATKVTPVTHIGPTKVRSSPPKPCCNTPQQTDDGESSMAKVTASDPRWQRARNLAASRLQQLFDSIVETQTRRAEDEIARYLPREARSTAEKSVARPRVR
jgi:hypothetical protein